MGFFNHLAKFTGETIRIKRNESNEQNLDPQTKQCLDNLIQCAENGDSNAMFELGGYYFKGEYVGYNPQAACYWWTESANRGNVNAQFNLGLLYHGEISTYYYDENLAGYWFNLAANNGDQEAYNMLAHYKYSSFWDKWIRR